MKIGVPKEIKPQENRIGLTPESVKVLTSSGHNVLVENNGGFEAGFYNNQYLDAGAKIVDKAEDIFSDADIIVKVKEPLSNEVKMIKENQIVFTYLHLAAAKELTEGLIKSKSVCIAYETVENSDRSLPLLTPMSEVAGRMAAQQGAKFLEKHQKGCGILLGGVPGVSPAKAVVLGGGVVGTQSAKMLAGLGADVTILDISLDRLRELDDIMPKNVKTKFSNQYNIKQEIQNAHLVIGAVLIAGAKAPNLITKDMLKDLRKGTVLVDVAVDQGGCFETTKPTTHSSPTYIIDDVLHYSVANMPGAVPMTSTEALTNATVAYAIEIANKGWKKACNENEPLKKGLNIINGDIVYKAVADAFDLNYTELNI